MTKFVEQAPFGRLPLQRIAMPIERLQFQLSEPAPQSLAQPPAHPLEAFPPQPPARRRPSQKRNQFLVARASLDPVAFTFFAVAPNEDAGRMASLNDAAREGFEELSTAASLACSGPVRRA